MPGFKQSPLKDAPPGAKCIACPSDIRVKLFPNKNGTFSPVCWKCILAVGDMIREKQSS